MPKHPQPDLPADTQSMECDAGQSLISWPALKPLVTTTKSAHNYPLDALPQLMRGAVIDYQAYGKQPIPMVASCALAALSLAGQGLANVARDSQLVGPISLNVLIVAASGERKSACDNAIAGAVRQWEKDQQDSIRPQIEKAKTQLAIWNEERQALGDTLKAAIKRSADTTGARQAIEKCDARKPKVPEKPCLLLEDVTPEKLLQDLQNGWPSAALWSAEAGTITGGAGTSDSSFVRFLATLNKLWDGSKVSERRKVSGDQEAEGRRLGVCMQIQPVVLTTFLQQGGGLARGSGFLARFLVVWPDTTKGQRPYSEPGPMPRLEKFNERIRALLDAPLPLDEVGRIAPPVLTLSAEAKARWVSFHDEMEAALAPGAALAKADDAAAKMAENAARIAALFHLLKHGPEGKIEIEDMAAASCLARWYAHEAVRATEQLSPSKELKDAKDLLSWLVDQADKCRTRQVIAQSGPWALRKDSARRKAALALLLDTGHIRERRSVSAHPIFEINPTLESACD